MSSSDSVDSFVVGDDEVELASDTSEDEFDFDSELETGSSSDGEEAADGADSDVVDLVSSDDEAGAASKRRGKGSGAGGRKGARASGKSSASGRRVPPRRRARQRKPWESDEDDTPAARRARVPHAVIHKRAVNDAQATRHMSAVLSTVSEYRAPADIGAFAWRVVTDVTTALTLGCCCHDHVVACDTLCPASS